jgi:flagellar biosynthesis protein FlhF
MNVRKFTARTSREALALVKQAFGADAVVLSNKNVPEGVEVLAMAPEGMGQIEQIAQTAPRTVARPPVQQVQPQSQPSQAQAQRAPFAERARQEPSFGAPEVGNDVEQLAMSTLSFQDYVRERVLRRRQAEMAGQPDPMAAAQPAPAPQTPPATSLDAARAQRERRAAEALAAMSPKRTAAPAKPAARPMPPVLRDEIRIPTALAPQQRAVPRLSDISDLATAEPLPLPGQPTATQRSQMDMASELRQMRGLIEERFSSLAFMEKLQRQPVQARLTQRLLELGFSPALVRKLAESCPSDFKPGEVADETAWAAHVLSRNLQTDEAAPAIEDRGGVFALIGSTGVGKTTTTAKLAAHFATKYGAGQLGLITLDAYRIGAHEQLRAYGRILGVPVHTAHDRASLDDLLDLLASKKLILIDTAGMAQRDSRTQELLEMLAHPSIKKLLVINAAQQGETIEDVVNAWKGAACEGVVLSKLDEAVKLAPALDTLIRHKLKVLGTANGQRVPEDWHRLPSPALVQRALKGAASGAWRMDNTDVNLIFAGAPLAEGLSRAVH